MPQAAPSSTDGALPDRLLPGEDPSTESAVVAARWHGAYGELISAKNSLIVDLDRSIASVGTDAQAELSAVDGVLLEQQRGRFLRRQAFWAQRQLELGGR